MTKMKDDKDNTEPTFKEIYNWIEDNSTYVETDKDGNTTSAIDVVCHEFIKALIRIEEFVAEVLSTDDPAFVMRERLIERNDIRKLQSHLDKLSLARHFTAVIKLFQNYSIEYKYSPHVELFFQCCFKLELASEWFSNPLANTSKPKKQFELFNELLELI